MMNHGKILQMFPGGLLLYHMYTDYENKITATRFKLQLNKPHNLTYEPEKNPPLPLSQNFGVTVSYRCLVLKKGQLVSKTERPGPGT
jgi:hypothetical protein